MLFSPIYLPILVIIASGFALGAPQTTSAGERPATWDMDLDELRAIGLGQSRGMPVFPEPALVGELEPRRAKQGVIFVHFDAITLQQGADDSHNNSSAIAGGEFAPYGGGQAERAALMEAVRLDWAAYNVLVVDERPASGDYTMNVTSPTNPFGGGALGVAPVDCFDQQTHNNITFAFHGANDGYSAATQATTVGQEVAHSYGLEHVDEPGDIMNPYNAGGDPSFMDACISIVPAPGVGIFCGEQHAVHCGDGEHQNAHRELIDLFGESAPDAQAPTVQIVSPADDAEYEAGAEFSIEVEAADDNAIMQVQLFNDDAPLQIDVTAPYGWEVTDIPVGTYAFQVVATDLAGNTAESNVVTVYVGATPSVDSGDDADDSGGPSDDDGDDSGDDGTGDTAGAGQDGGSADEGCNCRQSTGSGASLIGLALLLGIRRRRTHA